MTCIQSTAEPPPRDVGRLFDDPGTVTIQEEKL